MPMSRKTYILGLSAFYHDAAAALLVDGEIVAAAQEERFTRKKHDPGFPSQAVAYCLEEAGIEVQDLDLVGFYEKPLIKFDRLLETYLGYAPAGWRSFRRAIPRWLKERLHLPRVMDAQLGRRYRNPYVFLEHHESHAASAFFPSPFEEAAILTLDGVGEWATATIGIGRGNRIELTHELRFPHSLGLLYSAFTYYCGFRVNSGEYKLMGLAPYGVPRYADLIREKLLDIKEDGSFRLAMEYFNYCQGLTMTGERFHRLFGGPPRAPESPLEDRHMDLAASIQAVTEEIVLGMSRFVHEQTRMKHLCLAGGVALNCVANGRILREGPFSDLWIQPAAGDAGGALGTALFIWHQILENERRVGKRDSQRGSFLGPRTTSAQVRAYLEETGARYRRHEEESELIRNVVDLMAAGNVVGLFHGRMEFGPRALGNRSIIGDARNETMQSVMNLKIKFRESFRPFAPSVAQERVADYFDFDHGQESPYMLLVAPVRADRRVQNGKGGGKRGLDLLKVRRSEIPAVTHVDYSARLHTVDAERNPFYHRLLGAFEEKTGCPVIINTSFNVRGEPIVCTVADAFRCFMNTDMDVLVAEDCILVKGEQPAELAGDRGRYLDQFSLD